MTHDVLTMILAGGKGTRLDPLTRDRAKPAVPFAGIYRIIDFTLSNCLHSGLRQIQVLTQFKSRSLDRHMRLGWSFLPSVLGEFIEVLPPQQRIDEQWYQGTADAIYQNIYSIEQDGPSDILILAGDHIYRMDYRKLIADHRQKQAEMTIAAIPVPITETKHFGILTADSENRVHGFTEKPAFAPPMPDDPTHCLGSMGIYIFQTRVLLELLCEDAALKKSDRDFGRNIIPKMIDAGDRVYVHRFVDPVTGGKPYWRDVGTIDAYFDAHMDLCAESPELDLYDPDWPIHTIQPNDAPAKLIFAEAAQMPNLTGHVRNSLLSPGCHIRDADIVRCVLAPRVRVEAGSTLDKCVLHEDVSIGHDCTLRRVIIDKHVQLPPHTVIGYDVAFDRSRGFSISENGVVVVSKLTPPEMFLAPNSAPAKPLPE